MKRLFISALIATSLGGQPPSQPPAFRAGTDIVEVDTVVRDKSGAFVGDLNPEDFQVEENGKPQKIELFYVVGTSTSSITAEPGAASTPEPAAAAAGAPARAPRVFVVVFDSDHLTPAGFKRSQAAALNLFSMEFQPGDIGGVVADGRMLNKRLTSDREELVKAVRTAKSTLKGNTRYIARRSWPRMSDAEAVRIQLDNDQDVFNAVTARACADEPSECQFAGMAEGAVRSKAAQMSGQVVTSSTLTVQTLTALFDGLGPIDGRKTVLLMSEGFIAEGMWPLVQQAVGDAARSNTRVYALDARGLDTHGMAEYLGGASPRPGGMSGLLEQFDEGADAMNSMAVDTGGFVVKNRNNFDEAIARIVDDTRQYYVLGYRPDTPPDGKYRTISVKTTRPGLAVRARRGYVAAVRPVPTAMAAPAMAAPRAPRPNALEHVKMLAPRLGREAAAATNGPIDADAAAGWAAYRRGDFAAARKSLVAAASEPAAEPWVYYTLGHSEYALGHLDEALAQWERVRAGTPYFEPVYFDLVDGYLRQKKYADANRVLDAVIARWPADPAAFNARGVVAITSGVLDDAIAAFEKATTAAPGEAVGYFNLGRALELRFHRAQSRVRPATAKTESIDQDDRDGAIRNYKSYLQIGGPLAQSSRDGLKRLGEK